MPGISGAARLVKTAATSKTTKTAVKKAAKSDIVKTAVSGIVVDAALPQIKERVAQRLNNEEDTQTHQDSEDLTADDLGAWNEPTMLGLDNELYLSYLQNQITVLSEYETYLEEYDSADYTAYVNSFYKRCENPEIQLQAMQLVVKSMDEYKKYIENYAVRNDGFREHILDGPAEPEIDQSVLSSTGSIRTSLEEAETYVERCNEYISYLLKYTHEDEEFTTHISSYGNRITGDIEDLETTVLAELQYLSYLKEYTDQDIKFQEHMEGFSPEGEAYYSLIETENQLLKNLQNDDS